MMSSQGNVFPRIIPGIDYSWLGNSAKSGISVQKGEWKQALFFVPKRYITAESRAVIILFYYPSNHK